MKNEQELFNEISNVLHAHEDAYQPGAWEEFVKTKKRRRGFAYLRIAAAAAVLLITGYAVWLFMPVKPVDNDQPQTKNTPKPPYIYQKNGPGTDSPSTDRAIAFRKKETKGQVQAPSGNVATEKPANVNSPQFANTDNVDMPTLNTQPKNTEQRNKAEDIAVLLPGKPETLPANPQTEVKSTETLPVTAAAEPRRYERGTQRLNYDSLANLNKPKPVIAESKKANAFSYSLTVSPSVGNQKMNFGTGVEVAYNINKNFAVSSGLTYASVNAGSNRGAISAEGRQADLRSYNASLASSGFASSFNSSSFATSSTRTVQSVQMALSGVELPLNFQYKTKNGFYISAGVSAMSVIRNNISYDYLDSRTVSTPSSNGFSSPTISVLTEKTTQQSAETVNGFIGFYTLSAGKKVSFGKGKLNLAPFIKVPFNRVSSENLQLMHGGIQLGFGF